MARGKEIRKPKRKATVPADTVRTLPLVRLGFESSEEFRAWCDENGFRSRLRRTGWELPNEREAATRSIADAHLRERKRERRHDEESVRLIFSGQVPEEGADRQRHAVLVRVHERCKASHRVRNAALRLLRHLRRFPELLRLEPVVADYGWQAGNSFLEGLVTLARFEAQWIRPLEEWKPRTHNALRQFASLARHLFARWPVPAFMDSVWFRDESRTTERYRNWFRHLGRGENIRTADLPIPYTKRMAHWFMQAPGDLSVEGALRWGQVRALGGSGKLARAVIATRLGTNFEHDEFWITVVGWLAAQPMFDTAQVGPIVDFIHDQRFTIPVVFPAAGRAEPGTPAQPNFTMKGRTSESLLRQVAAWHRRLVHTRQHGAEWPAAGFGSFEFVEGSAENGTLKIWRLTELLSSKALMDEGRAMRHCVASYASSCARRHSSIWSLTVEELEGSRRALTVEVSLGGRRICQARGKFNKLPNDKERTVLRRWASQAQLVLGSGL